MATGWAAWPLFACNVPVLPCRVCIEANATAAPHCLTPPFARSTHMVLVDHVVNLQGNIQGG